eukprot:11037724-Prorocentrum_lima.AAC.1
MARPLPRKHQWYGWALASLSGVGKGGSEPVQQHTVAGSHPCHCGKPTAAWSAEGGEGGQVVMMGGSKGKATNWQWRNGGWSGGCVGGADGVGH